MKFANTFKELLYTCKFGYRNVNIDFVIIYLFNFFYRLLIEQIVEKQDVCIRSTILITRVFSLLRFFNIEVKIKFANTFKKLLYTLKFRSEKI